MVLFIDRRDLVWIFYSSLFSRRRQWGWHNSFETKIQHKHNHRSKAIVNYPIFLSLIFQETKESQNWEQPIRKSLIWSISTWFPQSSSLYFSNFHFYANCNQPYSFIKQKGYSSSTFWHAITNVEKDSSSRIHPSKHMVYLGWTKSCFNIHIRVYGKY